MTTPHPTRRRAAFTLIELLVVIVVIAVLAAASIPVFALAKQSANSARSLANLRQIGAALSAYQTDHGGRYPAVEGDSKLAILDNWVAELVIMLNPDETLASLENNPPTHIFVSPGISWPSPSGKGSYRLPEIMNTYAATDALVGLDYEDRPDETRGRLASTIERKPETVLVVEAKQAGSAPASFHWIPWSAASTDLGGDPESSQSVDFRYRKRVNGLMADFSAKSLGGTKDTSQLEEYNWNGIDYPK